MPGDVPETVTCEICGTTFDPTDSRGWCPNTDCGEWQHPAFRDGGEGADGGGAIDAPTKTCPECKKEVRADANFCKFCAYRFEDEDADATEPDTGSSGAESVLDECPDCGADLSRIPSERLSDCPICGTDLSDVLAASDEPPITPADLHACPACEADLTDIPPEMRLVCPGCHVSLENTIDEDVDAAHVHARVEVLDGIAEGYGGRLAEAGVETVGDLLRADPATLAGKTDIAESRVAEWIEQAPIDPADVGADAASADAEDATEPDAGDTTGAGEPATPEEPPTDRESSETPIRGGGADTGTAGDAGTAGDTSSAGDAGTAGEAESDGTAADAASGRGGETAGAASGGRGESVDATPGDASTSGGTGSPGVADDPGDLEMETQIQPPSPTVVLEVMGRDVHVEAGDTIGREIRTAMVEGGAPEDDAVYVHREHARLELVGGECYLTRLGENSLKVNDERVGEHERVRIESGDEVSFSEVVTATVRIE